MARTVVGDIDPEKTPVNDTKTYDNGVKLFHLYLPGQSSPT